MSEWRPLSFPVLMMTLACTTGLLTGCGGDDKVADLATPSTEPASSPVVPPYTTTLTLDEEQKKAADEAVVAVVRYLQVTNDVYARGGAGREAFADVAGGKLLETITAEAVDMQKAGKRMEGRIKPSAEEVVSVSMKERAKVTISACVSNDDFSFRNKDGSKSGQRKFKESTMKFEALRSAGAWKIVGQDVAKYSCKG